MRTALAATLGGAGLVAAAITAMVVWHAPHHAARAKRPTLGDDHPKHPGIHRAGPADRAAIERAGRFERARILAKRQLAKQSVPSTTWVSMGPTDAPQEVNYFEIAGVDSGRPNNIVVDPRDGNIVYMAVSGGGVWKSFDFLSGGTPTWAPTMDIEPNLAVGALALDPDHPDTLYVGTGDFVDTAGGSMQKSSDGGGTWSAPIALTGTHPNGFVATASSIRSIGVKGDQVLVGTDVGLFASTDAGATYHLVDLPNAAGQLLESIWSIVPVGGSAFVASGVTACAPGAGPPFIYYGNDPGGSCPAGNNIALWRTADGATWTEATTPSKIGAGNSLLAAGPTTDPAHTVVYAIVGGIGGDHTQGYWRSNDGGASYVDATGTLANPTLLAENGDDSCLTIDVGHAQSWYNEAIAVDPTNPDHVLVGGNLCGMRTVNGTSASPTWELVSHWLPGPGFGETAGGRLAYVHADWHTATSFVIDGRVTTFAGTDGGIFSSTNLFTSAAPEAVVWTHHNQGLATHLMYSVASGDPAAGNPFVTFSGLQDNGTRFRSTPAHPSAFNQPIGGDGIGAVVHNSTSGTTYWGSVEFGRLFCKPAEVDCSTEVPMAATDAESHWHSMPSPVGPSMEDDEVDERMKERARISGEDEDPFYIHYADVETDTAGQSVLTHTDERVFVSTPSGTGFVFTPISQDLTGDPTGAGFGNVTASRSTPGLYGAVGLVSAAPFYTTTTGNTPATWTATQPVHPLGTTARLTGASSMDFPPGGNGQVIVGAFTGLINTTGDVPPDDKGRLWRTTDGGATWTSIVGADPAHRLPNVPIYVVKYDPVTATTIYAGTQIGVYITTDDGATWDRMGDNFPLVPVRDMYVAKNQDFIRVATYGRGLWEIYPSAGANQGAPGNGDFDRNLIIDWVDVGAMSARLGETPMTTTAPLYSWILDMVAGDPAQPTQAIETDDLQALLAKFGGHP